MQFHSTYNLIAEFNHTCRWYVYCCYIIEGFVAWNGIIQFKSYCGLPMQIDAEVGLNTCSFYTAMQLFVL